MLHHLNTQPEDARIAASRRDKPERTNLLSRAILALRLRRRRRRAIADLESLTDHLLADIGLSRNEIPQAVDSLLSGAGAAPQPVTVVAAPGEPLRRAA
jgi:uncharacterized protein YjiS (DUF1127 family)